MKKDAIVTTRQGKLEGEIHNGVYAFRGIPYAAPPVGDLRWAPPQPAASWQGIRPAKEFGAIAPQNLMVAPTDSPGVPDFGNQPQSEDCLFLNIWTPALDDAKRPVLFWIHGGAFIIGSGSEPFLDSGVLVKRGDIVLVSINYRLGALGFMNLKEVTGGRIPATGNEGLLDQIAALAWVRDNIAAFGGNPDNVTVSGFSAGGMSTGTLLAVPAARGLFCQAMNRSGAANVVSNLEEAVGIAKEYLQIFGLTGKDVEDIRNLSTAQILEAQQELGDRLRNREQRATPFQPVVDGEVLPEMPMVAIRKGSARNINIMSGSSRDELKAMNAMNPALRNLDEAGLITMLRELLPADLVPRLIAAYRDSLKKAGVTPTPAEILGSINTDLMFRIPTIQLVEAQRDNGARAYNYLFTYRSPAMGGILGAMHGLDNPFLFGGLDPEFTGNGPEQQALAEKIQDSCAAFLHTGDPSCKSVGKWPVYGKNRATMIFDLDTRLEYAPFEEERRAWEGYDVINTRPL